MRTALFWPAPNSLYYTYIEHLKCWFCVLDDESLLDSAFWVDTCKIYACFFNLCTWNVWKSLILNSTPWIVTLWHNFVCFNVLKLVVWCLRVYIIMFSIYLRSWILELISWIKSWVLNLPVLHSKQIILFSLI